MMRTPAPPLPRPSGWRRLLALPDSMADFSRRGFRTEPAPAREILETAARTFLSGFNAELGVRPAAAPDLSGVPLVRRGFAVEGAAMAATLLDLPRPSARRSAALHHRYAARYVYLLHVGNGWALAKAHRRRLGRVGAEEPLLRWLAYDGMGFFAGFFGRPAPRHAGTCDATCEIRHQGLGRSLWFRACADPDAAASLVAALPRHHHGDLWSGLGLAASYAGGGSPETYRHLCELAGDHGPALAQGAAFAAEAWRLSGHTPEHARPAVQILTGVSPETAAAWTWAARRDLPGGTPDATHYRAWRLGIQRAAAEARV